MGKVQHIDIENPYSAQNDHRELGTGKTLVGLDQLHLGNDAHRARVVAQNEYLKDVLADREVTVTTIPAANIEPQDLFAQCPESRLGHPVAPAPNRAARRAAARKS